MREASWREEKAQETLSVVHTSNLKGARDKRRRSKWRSQEARLFRLRWGENSGRLLLLNREGKLS